MILKNTDYLSTGIFGTLTSEDRAFCLHTLQHAYPDGSIWVPKIPRGLYACKRGMHQLMGMLQPFETFEITGVTGHTDLLFHPGNTNADSSGCVLLGLFRNGDISIMHSKAAFANFMEYQTGINEFQLTVV